MDCLQARGSQRSTQLTKLTRKPPAFTACPSCSRPLRVDRVFSGLSLIADSRPLMAGSFSHLSNSSSRTAWSVFSSRYLMMTGV
jgi:hypothetical protein